MSYEYERVAPAAGLQRLAPSIIALAEAEGLRAHAASITIRLEDDSRR